MPRFPPHHFHGLNYRPRHPGSDGQFIHRPRGFPGPQQFPDYHHEGARFYGPHGHEMPPEPFFQRGPRPPYRGGIRGRHDGFPMAAHGHGPPRVQSHFNANGGFGNQNAFDINLANEGQFTPPSFHRPKNEPNDYNNFNANNRANNSSFNMKHGRGGGRGGARGDGARGGGHSFEQQGRGGKKKNKKAKAPKEINYSHYCDVCDRGFQADEELKKHIAEHVKCEEKECRFVGHPKVVKLHHKLHHGPGSRKIKWLDTPDEIQKWRNERKRNFPTAENVAKKGVKIGQREEQGNVLETKNFGKMKRTHRGKRGGVKYRQKMMMMAQANKSGGGNEGDAMPSDSDQIPSKRRKTDDGQEGKSSSAAEGQEAKASDPTQPTEGVATEHSNAFISQKTGQRGPERAVDCDPLSLLASHDNESGDEEAPGTQGVTPKIEVAPKGTFGALGSLAACYDSDSDGSFVEESDKATTVNDSVAQKVTSQEIPEQCLTEEGTKDKTPLGTESRQTVPAKYADETRCHGNGMNDERMDVHAVGQEKNSRSYRKDRRKQKRVPKNRGKGAQNRAEQKKATLLEMLLAPEIRRERNIILQCVRHVVKKNFFQGSQP